MSKEITKKADNPNYTLILIILWIFVALGSLAQDVMAALMQDRQINWRWARIEIFSWAMWIILTPFVVRLFRKIPLSWHKPKVVIPKIIGLIALIATLHVLLFILYLDFFWYLDTGDWFPPKKLYWFLCPQTFTTNFLVLSVIIGITLAFENYLLHQNLQLKSSQLETQLAEAKITALRTQLNPHFLFNTLNAINTLILKKDNANAEKMLNRLSLLLRETLDSGNGQWVTFEEELKFTKLFLDIYELRFSDRLNIDYDIDEKALMCNVPNFLLQPVVENAMVHGIAKMTTKGFLRLKAIQHEGRLKIEIFNNGPGMKTDHAKEGLGLKNTRERIQEMCEDVLLEYGNAPGGGFLVTIELPCNDRDC